MAANIVFRLTGGALNSSPAASLGGVASSVEISATALHNLFDAVSEAERQSGDVEYRAIEIVNTGDTDTGTQNLYIQSQTTSADTDIAIGYDATAGSHTLTDNLETIADESTAPASPAITFSQPTSGAPIALPSIVAGEGIRVWVRWTVNAGSTSFPSDTATLRLEYL